MKTVLISEGDSVHLKSGRAWSGGQSFLERDLYKMFAMVKASSFGRTHG